MLPLKNPRIAVPSVQKFENLTHAHIEKQFISVWQKIIMLSAHLKGGNMQIVRNYLLNAPLIVSKLLIIYLFLINLFFKLLCPSTFSCSARFLITKI